MLNILERCQAPVKLKRHANSVATRLEAGATNPRRLLSCPQDVFPLRHGAQQCGVAATVTTTQRTLWKMFSDASFTALTPQARTLRMPLSSTVATITLSTHRGRTLTRPAQGGPRRPGARPGSVFWMVIRPRSVILLPDHVHFGS